MIRYHFTVYQRDVRVGVKLEKRHKGFDALNSGTGPPQRSGFNASVAGEKQKYRAKRTRSEIHTRFLHLSFFAFATSDFLSLDVAPVAPFHSLICFSRSVCFFSTACKLSPGRHAGQEDYRP